MPTPSTPAKKLNFIMLTALVCGNMIGSGIFLLPSDLAHIGTISLYSWVFTAGGALLLALVFAELSHQFPKTGGPYAYARAGLGEFVGFQTAYQYWIALWVGNAAIALALVGYLRVFFPMLANPGASCLVAVSLIWILTGINCLGVRAAGFTQVITTILKLLPLIIVSLLGWQFIHWHYYTHYYNVTAHASNIGAVSTGATLTLWAFIGLESATVPADSVLNPKRNIPLATLVGTLLAAVVYIASSITIMGMIPAPALQHSTSPFADAAQLILGHWGGNAIALGAIISCFGTLNGWVLLQGQVAMAAAEDQLFPRYFARRNRANVPANALLITAILISILLFATLSNSLIKQFQTVILLATFATLIPYIYTTASAVILAYRNNQNDHRFFHLWKKISISVLAGCFSVWATLSSGNTTLKYGCLILISTIPLYAWIRYRQRNDHNSLSSSSTTMGITH